MTSGQLFLPTVPSCALIKSAFCTRDVSRVLSWPSASNPVLPTSARTSLLQTFSCRIFHPPSLPLWNLCQCLPSLAASRPHASATHRFSCQKPCPISSLPRKHLRILQNTTSGPLLCLPTIPYTSPSFCASSLTQIPDMEPHW